MPTLTGAQRIIDLGLQGATTALRSWAAPVPGTIKAIYVGVVVVPTTATLALAKYVATVACNVLSATNVDLAALSAGVAAAQTLATTPTSLHLNAGDMLQATHTMTSAGSCTSVACSVVFEPDYF